MYTSIGRLMSYTEKPFAIVVRFNYFWIYEYDTYSQLTRCTTHRFNAICFLVCT